MRELHVELLTGRKVVDRNGKKVGRIEEIVAEYRGAELIVIEVHVGRFGFAERFSLHGGLHDKKPTKLRWEDLDFTDPDHPRLKLAIEDL
jgi:sporulation protein YlmC with PRC-barrel domain